jgi:hypothetical protein
MSRATTFAANRAANRFVIEAMDGAVNGTGSGP